MPEQNSKVWRTLQQYGFTPIAIVAFVLMFLVPFVVHDEFLLRLLIVGLIYACLAMGFDFTAGFINIVNFGYAAFMGLGAYTSAILAVKFGLSPFIGFLVAPLVTALAGLLTGLLTLRLRGIFAAVFTWFVGLALMSVCANWVSLTKGHNGLSVPYLFSDPSNKPYYFVIALLCLITWVIMNRFARGHAGLTYKAIGDDMNAAMAAGINPTKVKVINFTVSCFIAGLAGAFYAHFVGVLTPKVMHTSNTIEVMAMAYLGGRGSIWGGFLAAIVFIPLLEYLKFLAEYRLIIYGILLVAVMIFYPDGFSGFVTNKLKKTKFGIFCRNLLQKLSPVKAKS
jgi:branched-chain amino acid transport system permease protein